MALGKQLGDEETRIFCSPGDLALAHEKDIEWITDLVIDAVAVIESKEEKRPMMRKWVAEQAKWKEEHMLQYCTQRPSSQEGPH